MLEQGAVGWILGEHGVDGKDQIGERGRRPVLGELEVCADGIVA
jgi:hypothetical protein